MGTFCFMCRTGDTYQAAGVGTFWGVIVLLCLIDLVHIVALGFGAPEGFCSLVACLLTGLLFYPKRRQLRAKLGGDSQNISSVSDFFLWSFCACCVVAQEARALDKAMNQKVECCCNLKAWELDQPLFVGQAVVAPVPSAPPASANAQ